MNREEAIEKLELMRQKVDEETYRALILAIKALEQEPCENKSIMNDTELDKAIRHIKTRADAWAVKEVTEALQSISERLDKALSQEPTFDDECQKDMDSVGTDTEKEKKNTLNT